MSISITYWIIIGIGALLSFGAKLWVESAFGRWSAIGTRRNMSGYDVAREILRVQGISDVRIERVDGFLSDHYDPSARVLRLSGHVYDGRSIAAAGVAAHEVGHALQHAQGYWPMRLRQKMVPAANIGTNLGLWLTMIGLLIGATGLASVGVALFAGFVVFTLVTLPVEFDASARAKRVLAAAGLLSADELQGVSRVLTAAAATYVAAAASAVLQLLYWLSVLAGRREA